MQQNLGVGLATKRPSRLFELAPQFAKVVCLSVVGDRSRSESHRLSATGRQVDDAESAMPESHVVIDKGALRIRTPMADSSHHPQDAALELVDRIPCPVEST